MAAESFRKLGLLDRSASPASNYYWKCLSKGALSGCGQDGCGVLYLNLMSKGHHAPSTVEEGDSLELVASEELRLRAKDMREIEGLDFREIAGRLEITEATVRKWARVGVWSVPKIVRHCVSEKMVIKRNTPALEASLSALYKRPRHEKEADFDQHMHDIACAVPYIIKQMSGDEWVTKADKIAKLVTMAREILGKDGGKKEQRPLVSIGVLSASVGKEKTVSGQVVELEALTEEEATG